ncbi:MAG: dephospho-CoA kinase [Actinomycetota bacterium]|nr:dephospho-CoA kinase [Actinomycetota bacterium]
MAPLLIGLTGGIAAGKSEALEAFGRIGAETISSDAVVHELLDSEQMRDRLIERWGPQIAPDGAIDRSRVGEIVFERPEELAWLEAELHPRVGERIDAWRRSLEPGTEFGVVEVPLLFETPMADAFDVTVAVVADDDTRRARAEQRGHALVDERAARQLDQDEKAARADHVVRNEGSLADLERELSDLLAKLESPEGRSGTEPVQR